MNVVFYEGPSRLGPDPVIGIATGMDRPSCNAGTGPMAQIWFLLKDIHPIEAMHTRQDQSICGECIMRPQGPGLSLRTCYVNPITLSHIYKTYTNGDFVRMTAKQLAQLIRKKGLSTRIGAYGDPAAVPLRAITPLLGRKAWTSYTSSWRVSQQQRVSMASCRTNEEAAEAIEKGYSVYLTVMPGSQPPPGAILCPKTELAGKKKICMTCMLCNGTPEGKKPKVIWTPLHGSFAQMSAAKTVFRLPVLQEAA